MGSMRSFLLCAAISTLVLTSCTTEKTGQQTEQASSFEAAMANYSSTIIKNSSGSITKATEPEKTTDMPSYVVKYTVVDSALLTSEGAANNPELYARNVGITNEWVQMFCTPELKKIMSEFKIGMVSGQLYSKDGMDSSMSACMNDS